MRPVAVALVAALVLSASPARAYDSVCLTAAGEDCPPGPATARERWLGRRDAHSDEHRLLFDFTRMFAGLPLALSQDFTIEVFTEGRPLPGGLSSLEPAPFSSVGAVERRTRALAEFAELPDLSYALWDWVRGNETCPLDDSLPQPAPVTDCHTFGSHMGAVNSNHFLPQAQQFYRHYHQLALARATECNRLAVQIPARGGTTDRFHPFLEACETEALVLEAIGQHYLQDAWSSGHMWQRWGSPDLADFASHADALLVAMTSGLIHGARGVLQLTPLIDVNDPLCAPNADVQWVGPQHPTPQPGVGDLYFNDLLTSGNFPAQRDQLFSCAVNGLREVYLAAGQQHGPATAPTGLRSVDPAGDDCFGQRVTNAAFNRGLGIDFFIIDQAVSLRLTLDGNQVPLLLPVFGSFVGNDLSGQSLPRTALYRMSLLELVSMSALVSAVRPEATDLAEGLLGPFMGVGTNQTYVRTIPASYADPALPWVRATLPSGPFGERSIWLGRAFHRAHAAEWCNIFRAGEPTGLDVDALRARASSQQDPAACAVCTELAARHLRFGTAADRHDTAHEPLCFYAADDGENAQYVYLDAPAGDAAAAAARWCGCAAATPDGGPVDGAPPPDAGMPDTAPALRCSLTGTFTTTRDVGCVPGAPIQGGMACRKSTGEIALSQNGQSITGGFQDGGGPGTLTGTLDGSTLTGIWQTPTVAIHSRCRAGELKLTFSSDCRTFVGSWTYCTGVPEGGGTWTGTRRSDICLFSCQ
jgi:hypothetical protein